MSDHLNECTPSFHDFDNCICDQLRACEQRVKETTIPKHRDEWIADGYHRGYDIGYEAGRDAALTLARDAVAALPKGGMGLRAHELWRNVLAAIDALQEKP